MVVYEVEAAPSACVISLTKRIDLACLLSIS